MQYCEQQEGGWGLGARQLCPTSSGLIVFCLFLHPQSVSVTPRVSSDGNDSLDERTQSLIDKRFVVVDDVIDKWV